MCCQFPRKHNAIQKSTLCTFKLKFHKLTFEGVYDCIFRTGSTPDFKADHFS